MKTLKIENNKKNASVKRKIYVFTIFIICLIFIILVANALYGMARPDSAYSAKKYLVSKYGFAENETEEVSYKETTSDDFLCDDCRPAEVVFTYKSKRISLTYNEYAKFWEDDYQSVEIWNDTVKLIKEYIPNVEVFEEFNIASGGVNEKYIGNNLMSIIPEMYPTGFLLYVPSNQNNNGQILKEVINNDRALSLFADLALAQHIEIYNERYTVGNDAIGVVGYSAMSGSSVFSETSKYYELNYQPDSKVMNLVFSYK